MKLTLPETPVEKSAAFAETSFGIGNLAVILEILRSKMYSNPIRTLCQEIMSNARDAHAESGKKDTAIEVTLPTIMDAHIRFRDFGPGITPERMTGVFLLYGASTKRDSNDQIGGFGLGAKSPFAYTDSFSVVSITPDENGQMWRREYVAVIDQTRIGKMNLVKEEHTTEVRGTTVIVPVRMSDFYAFSEAVRRTGCFWHTKPQVGPHAAWDWKEPKYTYTGDGWTLSGDGDDPLIVIDGIQYPLDVGRICGYSTDDLTRIAKHGIILHFKTGELQVTANREAIDLTPGAITLIKERIHEASKELKRWIDKKVSVASSYMEALELYREFHQFGMTTKWNGYKLTEEPIRLGNAEMVKVARYHKDEESLNGFTRTKIDRMHQSDYYHITMKEIFDPTILVVENDEYSLNRISYLFAEKPIDELILVTFKSPEYRETYVKEYNWERFGFTALSTYPKRKLNFVPPNTQGATIHAMKRFDPDQSPPWVPCKEDVATGTGVYVLLEHRRPLWKGNPIKKERLAGLLHQIKDDGEDITLYGVFMNRKSKIGPEWKELEVFLRERVAKIEKDPILKVGVHYDDTPKQVLNEYGSSMAIFRALCEVLPDDHLLNRWEQSADEARKAKTLRERLSHLKTLLGEADPEEAVYTPWTAMIDEKYPLLIPTLKGTEHLDSEGRQNITPHILAYIKSMDPITPAAAPVAAAIDSTAPVA